MSNIVDRFESVLKVLASQFLDDCRQLRKVEMVLLHKVLWAFGFLSLNALTSGLEFGVCENVVT